MKKIILSLSFLFVFIGLIQAQSALDFQIVNKTGYDLYGIYTTDANTKEWGEDILPEDILANNSAVDVTFNSVSGETLCSWDIMITTDESEEESIVVEGVDLCEVSVLTIFIEDGQVKYTTE